MIRCGFRMNKTVEEATEYSVKIVVDKNVKIKTPSDEKEIIVYNEK